MNRGAVGFFKCMECHFRYNIFYKFPRETFKFEQINLFEKNIINLNFILYISSLYYGTDGDVNFYVSSEMKTLKDCNYVQEFKPGHYMELSEGKYYKWYHYEYPLTDTKEEDCLNNIRKLFI